MSENFEGSHNQELPEGHQEKEKIELLLREAREGNLAIDVVMESFGKVVSIPDVVVIEINGDDLMLSYIADDGDLGEAIPVNINRIKRVDIVGPWSPPLEGLT